MDLAKILETLGGLYENYGYLIAFFSSLIETSPFGFAIPGGTFLAIGGFFAYESEINLFSLIFFGALGSWLTFLVSYYLGMKTGNFLIKKFKQEKYANYAEVLLKKHGGVILTTSMLANLTRFWVAYVAGMKHYRVSKFMFYSAGAALSWSSLMTVAGYLVGAEKGILENTLSGLGFLSWGIVVVSIVVVVLFARKEFRQNKGLGEK